MKYPSGSSGSDQIYVCQVGPLKIETQSERVLTISGKHLTNKSNALIEGIDITNRNTIFPATGFTAFFLNIRELVFEVTKLRQIHRTDIGDMRKLRVINLQRNNLNELSGDLFNDLRDLEYISLANNEIVSLPENLFYY